MDEATNAPEGAGRPRSFLMLLLYSLVLYNLGYVIDQTVRWSNSFHGLMNGLIHAVFLSVGWLMFLLPWSLLVWALYRWQGWRRFRTAWVLAPAVLILGVFLAGLVVSPPTARGRLHQCTGVRLPEECGDLRTEFTGGGVTDYGDLYYFTCAPEETERLVRELDLEEESMPLIEDGAGLLRHISVPQKDGWPDYGEWNGLVVYRWDDGHWFRYLLTDGGRTRVYLFVCCT